MTKKQTKLQKRNEKRALLTQEDIACLRGFKEVELKLENHVIEDEQHLQDALIEHCEKMISISFHHTLISITLLEDITAKEIYKAADQKHIVVPFSITTLYDQQTYSQDIELPIPFVIYQPPQKHALYFEAIIQLRNTDEQTTKHIVEQLQNNAIKISKEIEQKNGKDLYVDKAHKSFGILQKVKRQYGGTLVRSQKLNGVDQLKSKLRYRMTYLYKQHEDKNTVQ